MKIKPNLSNITILIISAFVLRIFLSFFGTLQLDFNTFMAWSNNLYKNGFVGFYNNWSDYLPGYLYILWFLAFIKNNLTFIPIEILYKLPAISSDVVTGFLIYKLTRKFSKSGRYSLLASFLYLFNPAIIANSTLWGQVDSLTALFSILSVYLANSSFIFSAIVLAIATAIKPQAALAFLAIFYLMIKKKWKLSKILVYILTGLTLFIIVFLPFAGEQNMFNFIIERIGVTINQYPYSSINAFNIWGLFGFWKSDSGGIISASTIGVLVTMIVSITSLFKLRKLKGGEYLLLTVLYLCNFLFFSRMHERHLLPVFAPLAISAVLIPDLWIVYILFSLTYLANLYYSYIWITQNFKVILSNFRVIFVIFINLLSFLFVMKVVFGSRDNNLLKIFKRTTFKNIPIWIKNFITMKEKVVFPKIKISNNLLNLFLIAVIVFAFASRVFDLGLPKNEYFDEVYHAFTAKTMKHLDAKAWEWWNPNPTGYAYEWTHPPVAKLGMWLGMTIFGENSFGWRIPGAILGTGTVFLVYLLALYLFKDKLLAVLSAFVFSLDGLTLVMSRIGMNDVYILFFVLLSIYLYFKNKNFLSALFFGLATASKWSAIWAIPIFFIAHFALKKRVKRGYLWFLLVPPLIYLASYIPMFLVGHHNFQTFIDVQKQMWWYHTKLRATHPYTSMWYTWPFLIRPIWLYTSGETAGKIANIYAFGNPFVFWTGIISVLILIYNAVLERSRKMALIVFSYLIFFVPWAASPRIMFLYHYLPSIPFMTISIGILLRKKPRLIFMILPLFIIAYLYFYPHWIGLNIPQFLDKSYYWFESWR